MIVIAAIAPGFGSQTRADRNVLRQTRASCTPVRRSNRSAIDQKNCRGRASPRREAQRVSTMKSVPRPVS
jgi:hypothetical protein